MDTSTAARDVWMRHVAAELAGVAVDFERLCDAHPDLAAELQALRDDWDRPSESHADPASNPDLSVESLLRKLAQPTPRAARYRVDGEIARGGMGVVLRAWDNDLQRTVALKRLRAAHSDPRALRRFFEEARVVAKLAHPAIVPVHDIGLDELSRPFFVMKLVEGEELRRIFEHAWSKSKGWTIERTLSVLLRVCEAVGYAHGHGVVHRDLKPSNVMVGGFGEVYVMDWGVARVRSELLQAQRSAPGSPMDASDALADPTLNTAQGEIIGTAAYMSPEQARGEVAELTPQSDIYSLGAMLYHLIARRAPYAAEGTTTARLLEQLRSGPPAALDADAAGVPRELIAICEKAMARAPERRYASMLDCAGDLRAFLEGRVVRAHRTGAWPAITKWVGRNRALAASAGAAVVLGAGALVMVERWTRVRDDMTLLSRLRQPTELLIELKLLWPPSRERLPEMQAWCANAERVAREMDSYREQLADLRRRAEPWDRQAAEERLAQRELDVRRARGLRLMEHLESERARLIRTGAERTADGMTVAEIDAQLAHDGPKVQKVMADDIERSTWRFPRPEEQLLHDRLAALIPDLERLSSNSNGFSAAQRVARAVERVQSADWSSSLRPDSWETAIAEIGDTQSCPQYRGLKLTPQEGLLPIGRDPDSGLWEFAHLASGPPPRRDADGRLRIDAESGVVLVLLPGEEFLQGTQGDDPAGARFDPWRQRDEGPPTVVLLDPFFVSKYEMTRSQWARWTGRDPSTAKHDSVDGRASEMTLPIESVSWDDCVDVLYELGLLLPTEAQWEYAARGGADGSWFDRGGTASLARFANIHDAALQRHLEREGAVGKWGLYLDTALIGEDGFAGSAPVGSLAANPFGLHDVLGNVAEWCADKGEFAYSTPRWLGDGGRATQGHDLGGRVVRGGCMYSPPEAARCAARRLIGAFNLGPDVGVRPVRALDRGR